MLTGVIVMQNGLDTALSYIVLGLIGTLIGVNVGGRKRYLSAVIDRSRQLLVERDQQAQLAAASERARIAREMHDIVSPLADGDRGAFRGCRRDARPRAGTQSGDPHGRHRSCGPDRDAIHARCAAG